MSVTEGARFGRELGAFVFDSAKTGVGFEGGTDDVAASVTVTFELG